MTITFLLTSGYFIDNLYHMPIMIVGNQVVPNYWSNRGSFSVDLKPTKEKSYATIQSTCGRGGSGHTCSD